MTVASKSHSSKGKFDLFLYVNVTVSSLGRLPLALDMAVIIHTISMHVVIQITANPMFVC